MSDRVNTPFTAEHFVAYCLRMVGHPYWYGTCGYQIPKLLPILLPIFYPHIACIQHATLISIMLPSLIQRVMYPDIQKAPKNKDFRGFSVSSEVLALLSAMLLVVYVIHRKCKRYTIAGSIV